MRTHRELTGRNLKQMFPATYIQHAQISCDNHVINWYHSNIITDQNTCALSWVWKLALHQALPLEMSLEISNKQTRRDKSRWAEGGEQ